MSILRARGERMEWMGTVSESDMRLIRTLVMERDDRLTMDVAKAYLRLLAQRVGWRAWVSGGLVKLIARWPNCSG